MRVFVAGATGAIGRRLVPQLVERGHDVVGTARSPEKVERLRSLGGAPVVLDILDRDAVSRAVAEARPGAIVHQATALAGATDFKHFDRTFAPTNRLRTEGTDALLAAAREVGVERVVAQSFTSWPYARVGGPIKTEEDPLLTASCAARDARGDSTPRGGRRRRGRHRAPLRRLLRVAGRCPARDRAQAAVPNRRGRRRPLVVRPPRRRGCGDRAGGRAREGGRLQHRG
jgi:NAD(P)-dependent dehydrogenase (short-subunit alcohol dehydrogenase family)